MQYVQCCTAGSHDGGTCACHLPYLRFQLGLHEKGACCRVTRQAVASKRCMHAFKILNSCLVMQVPSWLRDPLMWCYGLREGMAGLSRPASWAEAAIWLPCSQMEQILITRLPTQVNSKQTPMTCFSMLFEPFSHNSCIEWLCHATQQQ